MSLDAATAAILLATQTGVAALTAAAVNLWHLRRARNRLCTCGHGRGMHTDTTGPCQYSRMWGANPLLGWERARCACTCYDNPHATPVGDRSS